MTLIGKKNQMLFMMILAKVTKYLRSGGSRGEEQERGKGDGESEHFCGEKVAFAQAKIGTHSDYQQRSHGTAALPAAPPSFIPTATDRDGQQFLS